MWLHHMSLMSGSFLVPVGIKLMWCLIQKIPYNLLFIIDVIFSLSPCWWAKPTMLARHRITAALCAYLFAVTLARAALPLLLNAQVRLLGLDHGMTGPDRDPLQFPSHSRHLLCHGTQPRAICT